MKLIFVGLLSLMVLGCSKSNETETLLICEGERTSPLEGVGGKERQTFTISKVGDKVTKVKTEHSTYTLEKVNINKDTNKKPVYLQLIVEPDKLVLRAEITEDKRTNKTELFNTGAYKSSRTLNWSKGQCTVAQKPF